jgi:hypothetical protein
MRVYWTFTQMRGVDMLLLTGWIVLLGAAFVTIVGVLSNAGAAHPLTDRGYHLTGSIDTMFLFGIMLGAVASLQRGNRPPTKPYQSEGPRWAPTQPS